MSPETIREKLDTAYQTLFTHDSYLFLVGVNERSLTHKFAEYIQKEFLEWNVDCEYNRNFYDEKVGPLWETRRNQLLKVLERDITENRRNIILEMLDGGVSIYPDIIIHHRGTNNNLVVIEAKKTDFSGRDDDEEKLLTYLNESTFGYKFAFKVTFPSGEDKLKSFEIATGIKQVLRASTQ